MTKIVLETKLESLRKCMSRIESRMPSSAEELSTDLDIQDIVSLNLERSIQTCVDIASNLISELDITPPSTMAESFALLSQKKIICKRTALRMQKAVGFRNILVHQYQAINWTIVYKILKKHLSDFRDYAREILKWNSRKKS